MGEMAGDISMLPGASQCRKIGLQEGWRDLIRSQDYDHIQESLAAYAKQHCDVVLAQYEAALADAREAEATRKDLARELNDERVNGPASVGAPCQTVCQSYRTERTGASDGVVIVSAVSCFFNPFGCVLAAGTAASRGTKTVCERHGPDPSCVAETNRLKEEEQVVFDTRVLAMETRIEFYTSEAQKAQEAVEKLSVGNSRCSNTV